MGSAVPVSKNNSPGEAQQPLTQFDPIDPETLRLNLVITVFVKRCGTFSILRGAFSKAEVMH
jgi:hypothetical protein